LHGNIYTGDPAKPRAEAVAVSGEAIFAVGSNAEIEALKESGTQVIDLAGRFVMPGFNDAHVHLASGGQAQLEVNLEGARTIEEVQQRIRARLAEVKPGEWPREWIVGRGWDHTLWPDKEFPNRRQLDAVSKDHPMIFTHISGHVAVANSKALELAGVTRQTPNPSGGEIEHDASGEPTGMLKEGAAMALVYSKVPPLTHAQRRRGIGLALAEAARFGVTSIQDDSVRGDGAWENFLVYKELLREGKLTLRITEWLPFEETLPGLEELRREGGATDSWLRTGALKMVTDGALGSRTAAMLAPYSDDPSTSGILTIDPEKLKQMAVERDRAGFQLNFHAIGDRANRISLDAFAAARAANGPRDRRDRIEHAQVVAPEDFARFAELGVIASMQPSHETTDMRWAEQRVGPERAKGAYAWATMLKHGVHLAFGTDYPVETINPMRGLHACVTRELPEGGPAGGWEPQEKISLDECIHDYTVDSAYGEFQETRKGRIAPGMFADMIVLSADLTKIPSAEILKTKVLQTIVGGRTVFQAK
jgi:predicted amidohydrolase YtcJ